MRKLGVVALAALFMISAVYEVRAAQPVPLNTISRQFAPPPVGRKQGLLAISNRDWEDYTVVVTKKGRMSLYRGDSNYAGYLNYRIPAGTTVYLALEKDDWRISAENSDRLRVKVREGRTSTVSLNPFGFAGNSGLRGVSNDGDRVREEILFDNYTQPVIVQRPAPTVVIPPPPPTIIGRPPVIISGPPPRPYHRPPPPPPPRPRHRGDSWGMDFGFHRY